MAQARRWLETCISTHLTCPKPGSAFAQPEGYSVGHTRGPRRLIQISRRFKKYVRLDSPPTLRLIETPRSSWREYAALTYCWGGDQTVTLNTTNLVEWCLNIRFDDLPQTLRDAVVVTAQLGLKFLWVDTLCILQDDDVDKTNELSKMGDIYQNAHVTLSAARSASVNEGFLQSRYISGERGFRVPFLCHDGRLGSVILWIGREGAGAHEPINKRAWCLQESLLSPRVLEFGTHQLLWRCAQNRKEGQYEADGWAANVGPSDLHDRLAVPLWVDWTSQSNELTHFVWKNLVEHYSTRRLSSWDDRLRAISSVARKMSQIVRERYYAGLWEHHFKEQLLWSADRNHQERLTTMPRYFAPSWSWASYLGPVGFRHTLLDSTCMACMRVLQVEVVNKIPEDKFSDVISARLKARTLTTLAKRPESVISTTGVIEFYVRSDNQRLENVLYDLDGDVSLGHEVSLALVGRTQSYGMGLVLRPEASRQPVYTRIGVFQYLGDGNEFEWNETEITII